jgi:hypothetical protein
MDFVCSLRRAGIFQLGCASGSLCA